MKFTLFGFVAIVLGMATSVSAQDAASTPFRTTPPPAEETAPAAETPAPKPTPTPTPAATPRPTPVPEEVKPPPTPARPAQIKQEQPARPAASPAQTEATSAARTATVKAKPKPEEKPERSEPIENRDDGGGAAGVIKAFEKEWESAMVQHDTTVIERLVADDFIGVSSTGKIGGKLTLLHESKRDKNFYKSASARQLSVHTFGPHVAVVLGITREIGTDGAGRPFDRSFRFTDTWMERGGKWQCIAAHAAVASRR